MQLKINDSELLPAALQQTPEQFEQEAKWTIAVNYLKRSAFLQRLQQN